MPQMGESVNEGVVLEWHVEAGQAVAADDTVIEISTDKVDAEVPAPAAGTITETLVAAGDTVTVGQVLARMTTSGAGAAAPTATGGAPTPAARPSPSAGPAASSTSPATPPRSRVARPPRSASRSTHVAGSGRAGRIVKDDVIAAAANGGSGARKNGKAAAGDKPAGATLIKGGAAMLARYMDESRSIPTATSFRTLTVTTLDARRKQLKAAGLKVSFTHLIAYAIARAATTSR